MNLTKWLNSPFPRPKRNRRSLLWVTIIGLNGSLFIILFKPFGIENALDQWYYDLAIISMGIVFILSYLLVEWGVPSIIPKLFDRWNLKKAILWYAWVMLFVGAAMFLYKSYLAGFRDFTLTEYFFVIGRTFIIALTVSFFTLGIYQYFSRKTISVFQTSGNYVITLDNGRSISIDPKDILYVSSDDNYVDVHYLANGVRKKEVLRSSLKNVEAQLVDPLSPIFRCHRQYLVNTERFGLQKMTSRSMMITLLDHPDEVPVSRQYARKIKALLTVHPL